MKLRIAIMVLAYSCSVSGQGTFQNLNFEQANPVIVVGSSNPYFFTAASALPFWTVMIGGVQQTQITENDPSGGAPWVMLAGPGDALGPPPIDGNYSVFLQGSFFSSVPSISQTGTIPAGTQSLMFEAAPAQFAPFGTWASGRLFSYCAWNSLMTDRLQVIGDPFLTK